MRCFIISFLFTIFCYFYYKLFIGINKLFLKDEYFNVYIDIIKLFSKNPWTTQEDVFNQFKIKNKNDLITLNQIVRNCELAQKLILKFGTGKKYWNTIIPFAKTVEKTLNNQYLFCLILKISY